MVRMVIMLFLLAVLVALFLGRLAEVLAKRYRKRTSYGRSNAYRRDGGTKGNVNMGSLFCRCSMLLLAAAALAWSSLAFSGEIHDAAKVGNVEKVSTLLKSNPDLVSSKDASGWTPLVWAAAYGRKDVAALLIENKADVNVKDWKGLTPLHYAALKNHRDMAELLLAARAEVDARNDGGQTPLHDAAAMGNRNIAELLLEHRADINAEDNNGQTPMAWAAHEGYRDLAEFLRQHGGRQ